MSFRVRHGFECHSTVTVQRGEAEKGGQPWGARPLGALLGSWRLGGSGGEPASRVLTPSPAHRSTGLTCKNEDLYYVQDPAEPGRKAE